MRIAAELSENEIGFDDDFEACEAVYQPEIDTAATTSPRPRTSPRRKDIPCGVADFLLVALP